MDPSKLPVGGATVGCEAGLTEKLGEGNPEFPTSRQLDAGVRTGVTGNMAGVAPGFPVIASSETREVHIKIPVSVKILSNKLLNIIELG